jgi:hypothetical protein
MAEPSKRLRKQHLLVDIDSPMENLFRRLD